MESPYPGRKSASVPSDEDISDALSRVLNSGIFGAAPRLSAFLRFIVERSLAGEGARIKGYTIGVEALGREPSFDPQIDPIVRVEARRLRQRLARYYACEGFDDPVLIELPNGCYVPRFSWRDEAAPLATPASGEAPNALFRRVIELCRRQLHAIASEMAVLETMLNPAAGGQRVPAPAHRACPLCTALLPTAPSTSDSARPADGRQIRETGQIE